MTLGGLLLIALGGFWVAVPSALVPALLGVRGLAARVVAALVAGAANVVIVVTLLSFVDAFERSFLVVAHVVVGLGIVLLWQRAGRPSPFDDEDPGRLIRAARAGAREHPAVAAAVGVAAAALAVQLFLGIAVAQTNWDVLSYHLSRAAYWLQYDSVTQFPGGSTRQLGYPPNAELLQAWTMELSRGDRLVSVVQWLSGIGMALACFVAARALGFGRSGAVLAGALLIAMPIPILQTATSQNDVAVSFFLLAAVAFALRGLRGAGHQGDLVVAGAALGLAVGTKNTAVMALPGLALALAIVVHRLKPPRRTLALGAAAAIVGVLALGSFNYFANLRNTGSLTGDASNHLERHDPVVGNAVRIVWGFVDFPGTGVVAFDIVSQATAPDLLGEPKEHFSYVADTHPDDSRSAFGPVGLFLLGLVVVTAVRRRTPAERRALAVAALALILLLPVFVEWGEDITRVLLPAVAIGAPLLAAIGSREWRAVAVALSTLALAACVLVNDGRRMIAPGDAKVAWREDRIAQLTTKRAEMRPPLERIAERLPADAPLGFAGKDDSWDYPLFGARFDRRVVRLRPADANAEALRREGLTAIFFADVAPPARSGLTIEGLGPGYSLGRLPGG